MLNKSRLSQRPPLALLVVLRKAKRCVKFRGIEQRNIEVGVSHIATGGDGAVVHIEPSVTTRVPGAQQSSEGTRRARVPLWDPTQGSNRGSQLTMSLADARRSPGTKQHGEHRHRQAHVLEGHTQDLVVQSVKGLR